MTHPDLSALSYADARTELEQSKAELERVLGTPVEVAAYPYGRASAETVNAARDAGFRAACAATALGSRDLPHHLPRQDMTNRCTLFGLRLKRDDYEPLMRLAPARAAPTGPGLPMKPRVLVYHGVAEPNDGDIVAPPDSTPPRRGSHPLPPEAGVSVPDRRGTARRHALRANGSTDLRRWFPQLGDAAQPLLERLGSAGRSISALGGTACSTRRWPASRVACSTRPSPRLARSRGWSARTLADAPGPAQARRRRARARGASVKIAVESLTGRPCRTFAYPYGLYDERVTGRRGRAMSWPSPGCRGPGLLRPRLPAPPRHERFASRSSCSACGGPAADAVLGRHPDDAP